MKIFKFFGDIFDKLGAVPSLLLGLIVMAAMTAFMIWLFFKLPVKKGGVFGGLDSMTPEQRAEYEALREAWLAQRAAEKAAQEAEKNAVDALVEVVDEEAEDFAEAAGDFDADMISDAQGTADPEAPLTAAEYPEADTNGQRSSDAIGPEAGENGVAKDGR